MESKHPFPQPASVRITHAKGKAPVPQGDIGLQRSQEMHTSVCSRGVGAANYRLHQVFEGQAAYAL